LFGLTSLAVPLGYHIGDSTDLIG